MLKGIDTNEVSEYIAKNDTADNPTKFMICNITNRKKLGLFTGAMDKDGGIDLSKLQDRAFDILLAGLKSIKNLNGKDYEPVTEEVLNMLPLPVLTEVISRILEYNFMSEGEAKN
jgi:hypothetical protein